MRDIQKGALAVLLTVVSLPLASQIQETGTPQTSISRPAFGPQPVPPPPPTLEQLPASAPRVAFRSGQLTIVARNSSLGAILREVQSQTGATVDMPASPTERVVGQFGPGPAREVLAALLNGSRFNYVLMGSPQDPSSLDRVVLLKKSSAADAGSQGTHTAQAIVPRQGAVVIPDQDADENGQDNAEEMMAPEQPEQPEQAEEQANGNEQQNAQPAIKTPQQLLQELQHQQQMQQQGQPGSPQANPLPQQMQNRVDQ